MIYEFQKHIGETMNECLARFRQENAIPDNVKVCYTGRLDPLASGVIIMLTDNDVYKKDQYTGANKVYSFDCIVGVVTDSFDILGKIEESNLEYDNEMLSMVGKPYIQKYPVFSSIGVSVKTDDGRYIKVPIWKAYTEKMKIVEIPKKEVTIYHLKQTSEKFISSDELLSIIRRQFYTLTHDFKQKEILEQWEKYLVGNSDMFKIKSFTAEVSSGTYIRDICDRMNSTAFNICRQYYSF